MLDIMGKITKTKETTQKEPRFPYDQKKYEVKMDSLTDEEKDYLKKEMFKNNTDVTADSWFEKLYENWTLSKGKDNKELKKELKETWIFFKKQLVDWRKYSSEFRPIRAIVKEEYDSFIKPYIPPEGNAYRELVKFNKENALDKLPKTLTDSLDKLVNTYTDFAGKREKAIALSPKKNVGSPASSQESSKNSPKTPGQFKSRPSTKQTSLLTPGNSPGKSDKSSSSPPTSSPPVKRPPIVKRKVADMLEPPNPGIIETLSDGEIEDAVTTLKRLKNAATANEEENKRIQNKIHAYEEETRKRKGPTLCPLVKKMIHQRKMEEKGEIKHRR